MREGGREGGSEVAASPGALSVFEERAWGRGYYATRVEGKRREAGCIWGCVKL